MMKVQTPSTIVVPAERVCPRCGATLGGFGPEGLCGACLFDSGLATDDPAAELDLLASGVRRFGDYELLEEIARGGMGVVFRARQISLNRIVAVKMILRGEFASVTELARFRAEAETAARLHHPNIIAIHEVGEHEGQPFFSMDYIEGQNLAQLVGNTPLAATRAVKYLKTIAEAVHYAHQHGVLHRDLKPSNVLLDLNVQPHVTDFGLAKRLEGDASLTITGQVLGSPNFMPPEQATGRNILFGPASDVYSLGALLYHLLTGRPPFVAETITATLRLLAETEPASPRLLVPTVPTDSETICLKCLQKDPRRRYGSAQELAEELNRFLRDEPIHARPVTQRERFWRWCRRNRALATTGAAVLVLLLTVAIGSPIATLRINHERKRVEEAGKKEVQLRQQAETEQKKAQAEASKSRQVAQFLKDMLNGVGPAVALGRDTTLLREILDKTAERIGRDFTNQPDVEVELRTTLGGVYEDLGENAKAERMFREALAIRRRESGDDDLALTRPLEHLAWFLHNMNKYGEAEALFRQDLLILKNHLSDEQPRIADTITALARVIAHEGRLNEAESMHREALALRIKTLGNEHKAVADSLFHLSIVSQRQGKLDDAESLVRQVIAMTKKLFGDEHLEVAGTLNSLGNILSARGKLPAAEVAYRQALEIQNKAYGQGDDRTGGTLNNLVNVLISQRKLSEAEVILREKLAIARKLYGKENQAVAFELARLGYLFLKMHKLSEAEGFFREALAIFSGNLVIVSEYKEYVGYVEVVRGLVEILKSQPAEVETFLRQVLDHERQTLGHRHFAVARTEVNLAGLLKSHGKSDEAAGHYREAIEIVLQLSAEELRKLPAEAMAVMIHEGTQEQCGVICAKILAATWPDAEWLNGVSWGLLTSVPLAAWEAAAAVDLAQKAVAVGARTRPDILDTLAAAYAADGKFADAVSVQKEAMVLLKDEKMKNDFATRLKLYESNTPYHKP